MIDAILKNKKYNILIFIIIFIIFFLISFLVSYYEGFIFGRDTISSINQAMANQYNDWHPVIYTLIFHKFPLSLTGGIRYSVAIFNLICRSLVISYLLFLILKYINIKIFIIYFIYYIFSYHSIIAMRAPLKDVAFSIFGILLETMILKMFIDNNFNIKNIKTIIIGILLGLCTLMRHDGILWTLPFVISLFFLIDKKKVFKIIITAFIIIMLIKCALYPLLNVQKSNNKDLEIVGLPISIMMTAYKYDKNIFNQKEYNFLYDLYNGRMEVYDRYNDKVGFESIKWIPDKDYSFIINFEIMKKYSVLDILEMTLDLTIKRPDLAIYTFFQVTSSQYFIKSPTEKGYSGDIRDLLLYLYRSSEFFILYILLILSLIIKGKHDIRKVAISLVPIFRTCTSMLLLSGSTMTRINFIVQVTIPIILLINSRKMDIK